MEAEHGASAGACTVEAVRVRVKAARVKAARVKAATARVRVIVRVRVSTVQAPVLARWRW